METPHVLSTSWRHMETWRHSMSISTWRYADTPCPYPYGDMQKRHMDIHMRYADTPCPYSHGDMETLHVHIHMETWRHSMSISIWTWRHAETWRQGVTWRHSMSIHMETWGQGDMSIFTWRHGDTPCQYPHGDMDGDRETLHVHMHMET